MIRYQHPKTGLFSFHEGTWDKANNCWKNVQEERTIIGETQDNYITEFIETSCDYSDMTDYGGFAAHTAYYTLSIGPHKSRFIKWIPTQIKLF